MRTKKFPNSDTRAAAAAPQLPAPHGRTVEGGQIRKHIERLEKLILANDRGVAKTSVNHILRNLDALEEKYAALAAKDYAERRNPEVK